MAKKQVAENGFQELKNHIKAKTPGRVYVFFGEETFLLNHYLGQLRKILLDPLTESFNSHRFNNENFNMRDFAESVENLPMMAGYTMVLVADVDLFKLSEEERIKMTEVLSDVPEYCTIIFTHLTVQWKPDKRQKKLWEAIENNAIVVEFAKQEQRDLVAWVTRHFAAHQKRISANLCVYLIEITGGTMTALSSEIEKICAYSGSETICKEDIDAVTEPVMDAVVFQMTELISEGKYEQAFQKLQQLLKMQQEPLAILGAVGGHFRRLSTARVLLDSGKSSSELQKIYGIQDYPARKTMDAARRFRPAFCKYACERIMEADYGMKTSFDEPERLLETLVLELAQEARRV